ncbi:MAG: hypothetical protein H0T62_12335 [Parachlamydiaceae bacterium]|nr:hypothetical protein [Parachlamydiaceae bacterium]
MFLCPTFNFKNPILSARVFENGRNIGFSIKNCYSIRSGAIVDSTQREKILIITGGEAKMTPVINKEAEGRGYKVYHIQQKNNQQPENWQKIKFKDANFLDTSHWEGFFTDIIKNADSLSVVNTIGAAVAPKGKSLKDINEKPILSILEALKKIKKIPLRIGHVSSIAATYFPNDPKLHANIDSQAKEYCLGRKNVDLILAESPILTTILRPGFIFNDVISGRLIDTGHDYSPEQFTTLLLHPVIGSGTQPHQPVYVGDLVQALFNGMETDQNHLVDAVGPESMTQKEMIKFFLDLEEKPIRSVSIPHEVSAVIAKYFPKGRLAPYSVALLKHLEEHDRNPLCTASFEALVGKDLIKMRDIYKIPVDGFIYPSSPIPQHLVEIISGIATNSEARRDILRITKKHGPYLILNALKALFKPT